MVHNEAYRKTFISTTITFLKNNGFDGLGKKLKYFLKIRFFEQNLK